MVKAVYRLCETLLLSGHGSIGLALWTQAFLLLFSRFVFSFFFNLASFPFATREAGQVNEVSGYWQLDGSFTAPNGKKLKAILWKLQTKRKYCLYYFHVNGSIGIVQKIDFEIRPDLWCTTPKTSRKVVLDNPSVCLSVCLAVCLSCCRFSRELSQA